jgi:hypothetical protein
VLEPAGTTYSSEDSREHEGDEPHCPDRRNTDAGEEEKEGELEKKMQEVLSRSPLSSGPAPLGWPYQVALAETQLP